MDKLQHIKHSIVDKTPITLIYTKLGEKTCFLLDTTKYDTVTINEKDIHMGNAISRASIEITKDTLSFVQGDEYFIGSILKNNYEYRLCKEEVGNEGS